MLFVKIGKIIGFGIIVFTFLMLGNSAVARNFYESFDDPSLAPSYSFDDYKFGDTGNPWMIAGLGRGGINDSGCVQVIAVNQDQDDCWYAIYLNEGDFVWSGCWKFSADWLDSGLVDQKLTYIYGTGGNLNLFWHSGGDWPPNAWSRLGIELAHYSVIGGWVSANAEENLSRHTNYLLLREHHNRWICIRHHVDVDQTPWKHKYWVTTEGSDDITEGSCRRIDGRMEFNNFKYLDIEEDFDPAVCTLIKYGAFVNESVGYGIMHLDEFNISDSAVGGGLIKSEDDGCFIKIINR